MSVKIIMREGEVGGIRKQKFVWRSEESDGVSGEGGDG